MQHTTNYNLPQWEATDAIKREDVNGAMAAVDAAIKRIDGAIHVEYLSYVGTGGSGYVSPTIIEFPHKPEFFLIVAHNIVVLGYGEISAIFVDKNQSDLCVYVIQGLTWNGNTVTFRAYDERHQANESGFPYRVISFYRPDAQA